MTAGGGVERFGSEAEMVTAWLQQLRQYNRFDQDWTVYAETAGWDLLLVHRDGFQLGIEAKLGLNAKVLDQALEGANSHWREEGPDYRAVLVPRDKIQHHLGRIANALGIKIIPVRPGNFGSSSGDLPDERRPSDNWPNWCPAQRCTLPDYIPDVSAGHPCPVMLTPWKVKAIKLLILLERRGHVSRADMKALQINPTRWTDHWHGFLSPDPGAGGYVRNGRTPDLKAQHPTNWAEIEADFSKWCPPGYLIELEAA